MTNVESMDYTTLTLPPLLASLVPRTFRRYHKPTIYLPQNSHHTYLLWNFQIFFKTITFFIANSGTIVPIANIPEI